MHDGFVQWNISCLFAVLFLILASSSLLAIKYGRGFNAIPSQCFLKIRVHLYSETSSSLQVFKLPALAQKNTSFLCAPVIYFCVLSLVRRLFRCFFAIFHLNLMNSAFFLGFTLFGFQLQFPSHTKSFTWHLKFLYRVCGHL